VDARRDLGGAGMTMTADRPERLELLEDAAIATPEFEKAAERAASRRGFLLSLPAYAYLALFFAVPLGRGFQHPASGCRQCPCPMLLPPPLSPRSAPLSGRVCPRNPAARRA